MSGQLKKNGACIAAGLRKRAPGAAGRITGAGEAGGGGCGARKSAPGARKGAIGA